MSRWAWHLGLDGTSWRWARVPLSVLKYAFLLLVKNLPAVQETQVQSLGREDPLEKEMATHASILAWKIPWTEEPGGIQSVGWQSDMAEWLNSNSRQRTREHLRGCE